MEIDKKNEKYGLETFNCCTELKIEPPFVLGFAAPKKSGKTFQIINLLKHCYKHTFDHILIFSPTLELEDEYKEIETETFGGTKIHKFSCKIPEAMEIAWDEQVDAVSKHRQNPDIYEAPQTLFILDDCIDTDIMRFNSSNNFIDVLTMRGRHANASAIYVTQSLSAVSLNARKNTDAMFVFSPINMRESETILEQYVPRELKKEFLAKVREVYKTQYSFIIIDSTGKRRTDFKKRIRIGYCELLFNGEPGAEDFKREMIGVEPNKLKRRRITKKNK